jgi:carbon storage regulator
MLVLERKPGQKILIGNDVTLIVKEIKGNAVRLGIEAPEEIKVWRDEVFQAKIKDFLEKNKT